MSATLQAQLAGLRGEGKKLANEVAELERELTGKKADLANVEAEIRAVEEFLAPREGVSA